MHRGYLITSTFIAAAAAVIFSVAACAGGSDNPAASALSRWKAGTNYTLLEKPQRVVVAPGKVLVNEVFWYGCGHCNALDPTLEAWRLSKPQYVEFVRIPVIWGPVHRQHAKLFYTLQALGRTDLHARVFEAIHHDGNILAAQTDGDARALHLAFLQQHGVTEKAFNDAYDSPEVAGNLQRAEEFTRDYQVTSVPVMFVDGKYTTSVSEAGGNSELISLLNDLAASERQRR
jgi:thiol:disulfide interchange protein DsbA